MPLLPRRIPNPQDLPVEIGAAPPPDVLTAFNAERAIIYRYVDIFESDGVTPWRTNVGVTEGGVTVDIARQERRSLDLTLANEDGNLPYGPNGGLWYDKVIKPYSGVILRDGIWVTQLGEFMIDAAERAHFPSSVKVTGRDFTKKLMKDEIASTSTFNSGTNIGTLIRNIAASAGITKFNISPTTQTTSTKFTFERGTPRWEIISKLAGSYGLEIFFDSFGYLTVRPQVDPVTAPISHEFKSGRGGNISSFSKRTNDSRLYNHVLAYGDSQHNPLVFGQASNTSASSPTAISKIGRRTYRYSSQFFTNNTQAANTAASFLAVMALEQYDVGLDALNAPWLEGGEACRFLDPTAEEGEPDIFLMSDFTIPMALGTMSVTAKRVHLVGS